MCSAKGHVRLALKADAQRATSDVG